jgi:predicted Zn-dependent protease
VELEEAVRLRPKLVEAQRSLATALASEGRVTDAIAHLERSISANPGDPSLERMLAELQSRGRKPGER